jgi:imidazolonepropionase-like amidohydrolase
MTILEPGSHLSSIRCAKLFDGRQVLENVQVKIVDGKIASVRELHQRPEDGDQSDSGPLVPFLLPGLIDAHVHATGYIEGLPAGAPFEPMKHFMRLCAANGVTTIRDTGNSLETLLYLREWGSRFDGPRIAGSGPLLDNPPFTWMFSRIVRDETSARTAVMNVLDGGADFIKAYRNITAPVLAAIVAVAAERDRYVAIHNEKTSALEAVQIGVKSLEHASNLLDEKALGEPVQAADGMVGIAKLWRSADLASSYIHELRDAMLEKTTILVPSLLVSKRWALLDEMINEPNADYMIPIMPYHRWFKSMRSPLGQRIGRHFLAKYMPVEALSRRDRIDVQSGLQRMAELTGLLSARGVTIAAGTDSPNPSLVPGYSLHDEIVELASVAGLGALGALRAATYNAGLLIPGMRVGVIETGAEADFCVVNGRPDEHIDDIREITHVIKQGKVLDRNAMLTRVREAADAIKSRG